MGKAALFGLALLSSIALISFSTSTSENRSHRRLAFHKGGRARFRNPVGEWAIAFKLQPNEHFQVFKITNVKHGQVTLRRYVNCYSPDNKRTKKKITLEIPQEELIEVDIEDMGEMSAILAAMQLDQDKVTKKHNISAPHTGRQRSDTLPELSIIPPSRREEIDQKYQTTLLNRESDLRLATTKLATQKFVAEEKQKIIFTSADWKIINEFKSELIFGAKVWETNTRRYLMQVGEKTQTFREIYNGNSAEGADKSCRIASLLIPSGQEVQCVANDSGLTDLYFNGRDNQLLVKVRCRTQHTTPKGTVKAFREGWIIAATGYKKDNTFVLEKHIKFLRDGSDEKELGSFQV